VPWASPESVADTETLAVPLPAPDEAVCEPYDVLVPYSTYQFVETPPGLTVPVTFAEVAPTELTGPVTAVGAAAWAPTAVMRRTADAARDASGSFTCLPKLSRQRSRFRESRVKGP
jgi:hypothetical protein